MVFILLLKKFKCARKGLSFLVLNALIFFPNIINAQNFWEKLNFTGEITFRTTAVTDFYNFDIIFPDDGTKLYNYESNIQGFALNPGLLFNDAYLNIEYFPSLRYDVVRNVLGVENAKKREFIIDHNFNFGIKWKKLVYGLGMTIINAGKGYYFVNPMPIIRYNDIEFKTYNVYVVIPIKPLLIEVKMLYIPRGFPQDLDGKYNMYSLRLFYNFQALNIFTKKQGTSASE